MALHRLLVIGLDVPSERALVALANAADIDRKNIKFFDRSDDIRYIIDTSFNTEKGSPYYGNSKVILMDNIPQERLLKFRQLTKAMEVSENHQAISSLDDLTESLIDDWFRNVRFSDEELERALKESKEAPSELSEDDQILDLLSGPPPGSKKAPRGDDLVTVLGPKHRMTEDVTSFMSDIPDKDAMSQVISEAKDPVTVPDLITDFDPLDDDYDPLADIAPTPVEKEVTPIDDDYDPFADIGAAEPADPLADIGSEKSNDVLSGINFEDEPEDDPLADVVSEDPLAGVVEDDPLADIVQEDPLSDIGSEDPLADIVEEDPLADIMAEPAIAEESASPIVPVTTELIDEPEIAVPRSRLTEYVPEKPPAPVREEEPEVTDIVPRQELLRQQEEAARSAISDSERAKIKARKARDEAEGRSLGSGDATSMFSDNEDAAEGNSLDHAPKPVTTGMEFESIPVADDIMSKDRARSQKVYEQDREMYRRARSPEHSIGHRGRIIACSGGSGGTGKTVTAWGMWYALILARNESGENERGTWLIEADYDSPKYQRVHMDMKDTQDLGSFAKLLRSNAEKGVTMTKEEIQSALINEFSYMDEDHGGRILACPRDRGDIEDKYLFMAIVQAIRAVSDMGGAVIVDMADSDNRNATAVNNVILHRLADQIVLTCTPSTAGSVRDLAKNITSADRTGARPYKPVPPGRVHLALLQSTDEQQSYLQENFFPPLTIDIFIPTIPDLLPTNLPINKMGIGHISMSSKAVKRAVMIRCGSLLVSCGYSDYDKFFRSNPNITSGSSQARKPGFIERIASKFA